MINKFNVSEARSAIICPRIFYFDEARARTAPQMQKRLTRIWCEGDKEDTVGCGALFHNTIEKFNKLACDAHSVRKALEEAASMADEKARSEHLVKAFRLFVNVECLNRDRLAARSVEQKMAFIAAINLYFGEIAAILGYAVTHGRKVAEVIDEFFGDNRKRVDVTFHVGQELQEVQIRGSVDFIYFDYRQDANRIIDFKLTPSTSLAKDLFQASLYALMHNQQHRTKSDVGVVYLHPHLAVSDKRWADIYQERSKAYDLLASMVAWSEFDEKTGAGLKPPGEPGVCHVCPWNKRGQCESRLGPKTEGDWVHKWSNAAGAQQEEEPEIESHDPPEPCEDIEYDDTGEVACEAEIVGEPEDQVPISGIQVGLTVESRKPVVIPVASLKTHVSVLGAAGSGKSYLSKVIAEEAILQSVPVLAIDPQGDLVQYLRPSQLLPEATAAERRRQDEFRQRAEVRVWTPGTSHGIRLCMSPLRLPKEADLQGMESPLRRREEWDALLGVAAGNLVELASAGGDAEVQRTFMLEVLRALTAQTPVRCDLGLGDIVSALQAPDSLGLEEAGENISKRDREKLKQKLYARLRGPTAGLFNGGIPLDLDRFVQPLHEGGTPLNVVYLNALTDDDQKQYFVASLAAEIYRWMITSPSTGKVRLLVYLDEAKDFLPAGSSKPPAKDPLLRLFAQGRKYGVSCLICTQSPRSVDYNVFSNASTKLIGRLEAAQDVQRVSEWFKDCAGAPRWLAGRNGAKNHTFAGRWPEIPAELQDAEFRSRQLYSMHEAAWSPDQVEAEWAKSPLAATFREQTFSGSAG